MFWVPIITANPTQNTQLCFVFLSLSGLVSFDLRRIVMAAANTTQRPRKNRPGSFIYDCRPCAAEEKDFRLSCSFAKKFSKWVDEQPRKNLILKIGFDKRQNPQSGLGTRSASSVYVRVYLYTQARESRDGCFDPPKQQRRPRFWAWKNRVPFGSIIKTQIGSVE